MSWRRPKYRSPDVEVLSEQTVFQGFYQMVKYRLRHRLFGGGWSRAIERELLQRGSSVAVLAVDPEHQLVALVEQFRIGAIGETDGPWLLEVVAGMVDKGETPAQVAERELIEETGIRARELRPMLDYLSSPGGSSEKLYLFVALADLSQSAAAVHGLEAEGEDIYLHILPITEAFDALQQGRCKDAATVISLQWLKLHLGSVIAQ